MAEKSTGEKGSVAAFLSLFSELGPWSWGALLDSHPHLPMSDLSNRPFPKCEQLNTMRFECLTFEISNLPLLFCKLKELSNGIWHAHIPPSLTPHSAQAWNLSWSLFSPLNFARKWRHGLYAGDVSMATTHGVTSTLSSFGVSTISKWFWRHDPLLMTGMTSESPGNGV